MLTLDAMNGVNICVCCRPLITDPTSNSPGYGAQINVNLIYAVEDGGATPQDITRVVMISENGITHSTHFDQREVCAPCYPI